MQFENLLQIATNALAAGFGTGMGIAFGTWLIQRHVISKMDKNGQKSSKDGIKRHG